jgi:hypothetical protein
LDILLRRRFYQASSHELRVVANTDPQSSGKSGTGTNRSIAAAIDAWISALSLQ